MDGEQQFWLKLWTIIIAAITIITISIVGMTLLHREVMANKGYQMEMVVGYRSPIWKKIK